MHTKKISTEFFNLFQNKLFVFFVLVLIVFSAGLISSVFLEKTGGTGLFEDKENVSIEFTDFDLEFSDKIEFSVLVMSNYKAQGKLEVFLNNEKFTEQELLPLNKQKVNLSIEGRPGSNDISVRYLDREIAFETKQVDSNFSNSIGELDIDNDILKVELSNNQKGFYTAEIFVNGILQKEKLVNFSNKETVVLEEKLNLKDGNNKIKIAFLDNEKETTTTHSKDIESSFAIGIVFILLILILLFLAFSNRSFVEQVSLSVTTLFGIFVVLIFILNFFNFLDITTLFISLAFVILILFSYVFGKFNRGEIKINVLNKSERLIVSIFFITLIFITFFIAINPSQDSNWSIFYERHSAELLDSFSLKEFDELSYLGRNFSYVPGYFFIEATFGWLLNIDTSVLFLVMKIFAFMFFVFALFSFTESFGININSGILMLFLAMLETFNTFAILFSPKHLIVFGLFLVALSMLKKKEYCFATLSLLIMTLLQISAILWFFIVLMFIKDFDWKDVFSIIKAIVLSVIIYLPQLFNLEIISQSAMKEWGYLLSSNLFLFFLEYGPILILLMIISLIMFLINFKKQDFSNKKLVAGIALTLIIGLFFTYRILIFAFVLIYLLIDKKLVSKWSNKQFFGVLFVTIILVTGVFVISATNTTVIQDKQGIEVADTRFFADDIYAMKFGEKLEDVNVLGTPTMGNGIAYFSKQASLSDLYVEFSEEQKIADNYDYFKSYDETLLKKNKINWLFMPDKVELSGYGKLVSVRKEVVPGIKIYSNGKYDWYFYQ